MLLDTGADISVLPLTLARLLGIGDADLLKTSTTGIGGPAEALRLITKPRVRATMRTGKLVDEFELPNLLFQKDPPPDADGRRRTAPAIIGRDALFGFLGDHTKSRFVADCEFRLRLERNSIELKRKT